MRVRCLARELTEEQREASSAPSVFKPRYQITEGRVYTVLGISFFLSSSVFGKCCLYSIQDDAGRCVFVPNALAEITDGRASSFWIAKMDDDFNMTLWPEEFYQEFFHDRLSDAEPEAVDAFKCAISRLEAEFVSS